MSIRKKVWLSFGGILLLTAVVVLVDLPQGPDLRIGNIDRELKVHFGLDLQGGSSLTYEANMSDLAEADRAEAIEGVRDVIERRINAFGVSEPVIQTNRFGESFRVIVELPGIQDIDQAISEIGETPLLEFREQKELTEEEKKAIEALNAEAKKNAEETLTKTLVPNADFARLANELSQDSGNINFETGEKKGGDLDFFGKGAMVPEFEAAVFSNEPGTVVPNLVETSFGYHIIKVTEKKEENGSEQRRASHILFRKQSLDNQNRFENTELTGAHLDKAAVVFDQTTNVPEVNLQFNDEGAKLFEAITERNVSKPVGIYLDGTAISIPTVNQKISGGQAVITGDFALDEAKQLARRLNAGALPVPIELVSQENVGPSLGKVAVQKSVIAGLIGLIAVALFMIAYYRLPGLLSVGALLIYVMLVLSVFKLLPVTLTLAGIAGFILSVGMAVDANILIFERMLEELRDGKSLPVAIEDGFDRAWLSIRDSNISSLITALILIWFGTSIVKGFAITLSIGILISMFSAITISRTFLRLIAGSVLKKRLTLFGLTKTHD